ncbi:XRE family transcriptional regulator [Pseudoflavonifractor sp. 60]|nr:XRE family transcriptional regulator [Pseudoflavonifractor sp. 60]
MAIREYLVSHGIKQSFVAEKCGWSKQKINSIATGKQKITAEEYGRLCNAIGLPYDYFYNAAEDLA